MTIEATIKTESGVRYESHVVDSAYSPEQRRIAGQRTDNWREKIKSDNPGAEITFAAYSD